VLLSLFFVNIDEASKIPKSCEDGRARACAFLLLVKRMLLLHLTTSLCVKNHTVLPIVSNFKGFDYIEKSWTLFSREKYTYGL
jgi:hypothetical protein